jgi:hypothetical protein
MSKIRMTESEWRTLDDFRRYWHAFAQCDLIPIDGDDFTDRLEAAGYIEMAKVTKRVLAETSFADELGFELGGNYWRLTKKGFAALEADRPKTSEAADE